MNNVQIMAVFEVPAFRRLEKSARVLWIYLAFEYVQGNKRHKIEELSAQHGFAANTILAAVKALEAAGAIKVERRPGEANLYYPVQPLQWKPSLADSAA